LRRVLIDKNILWLAKDKELLKDYEFPPLEVGKDMKQTSLDENCGSFCYDRNCDFITGDDTAYKHFFKNKKIKSIEISEFYYEKKAERQLYLVKIFRK